jgi:hypothetical protein
MAEQPNAQLKESNEILDARMEYGLLMSNYITLANMFWVGYGAFFTINSLLATALGVSYSEAARPLDATFLLLIHMLIPLTGMFISACAIYSVVMMALNQHLVAQRGQELETKLLHALIFKRMRSRSKPLPLWTIIGSLLFALIWASALLAIKR